MVQFTELEGENEKIKEILHDENENQPSSSFVAEEQDQDQDEWDDEIDGAATNDNNNNEDDDDDDDHDMMMVDSHDDDILNESVLDRICALVDIVPPTTRVYLQTASSQAFYTSLSLGKILFSSLSFLSFACIHQ